jgi:cytochrome c biogenesis protein CcmG/thiol:disulfide interchange protein DsbE
MSTASSEGPAKRRRNVLVFLPLIAFAALAALFFYRLGAGDPSRLPSALIGRPIPATDLPPLPGLERDGKPVPGLSNATFQGAVTLVNVWASWCVPCHDEVPFLDQLSKDNRMRGGFSIATVILSWRAAATTPDARRLIGASMAYLKPFWSVATAVSLTSS